MPGNAFNYWTCCNHSFPMYWVHVPLHLGFKGAYFIYRSQDFKYRSCISCLQEQSAQIKRPMHPTMYMYRYEDITTLDIVQDISVPFKDPFLGQQATVKSFSSHSKLSPSNCGKISCSHCRKASWSFSANLGESRTQTSRDLTHFWGPTN